jgi:hypothetical protein
MAAGLGFKDFVTGEVLTAADVDGYLMQGIWVFANSTARDAAVTSPQEGNFAFLKDTNTTTYYTGSAWTNLDTTGMVNPMTTTGDTIYSSSGSTPARLGIGTAGQVLRVNSGATAPEWATPAGASITSATALVSAYQGTTSSTYTDLTTPGPAVTLTTGTKALVLMSAYIEGSDVSTQSWMGCTISGATTNAAGDDKSGGFSQAVAGEWIKFTVAKTYTTLTAGSNTFTMKYRRDGSGTASFADREITVIDLGS